MEFLVYLKDRKLNPTVVTHVFSFMEVKAYIDMKGVQRHK